MAGATCSAHLARRDLSSLSWSSWARAIEEVEPRAARRATSGWRSRVAGWAARGQERLRRLVTSDLFDFCLCAAILLNALVIGAQVDRAARSRAAAPEAAAPFQAAHGVFLGVFGLELLLRVCAQGPGFFCSARDLGWNLFDTVLVLLGAAEQLLAVLCSDSSPSPQSNRGMSAVRALRLLRLLRTLRVLRLMRFVRELRKVIYLVVASFWSFVWTCLLLCLLTYLVALLIMQGVVDHGQKYPDDVAPGMPLNSSWGSLPRAFLILFQSITGGVNWGDVTTPLMDLVTPWFGLTFAIYVFFCVLVLLNLVTGVFVDSARKLYIEDKERDLLKKIRQAFGKAACSNQRISWEDFTDHFGRQEMRDLFETMGVSIARAEDFFNFLDVEGTGFLTLEAFATGAVKLQGPTRALEFAMFAQEVQGHLVHLTQQLTILTGSAERPRAVTRCGRVAVHRR